VGFLKRTGEVHQVGKVRNCKNAYKNGTWSTFSTFFDVSVVTKSGHVVMLVSTTVD
jgi:hypothetical protein